MENLRFKLQGNGLITPEACESKDAGRMVSEIQFRLDGDEAIWEKLIQVLNECDKNSLIQKLDSEIGRGVLPGGGITARKFEKKIIKILVDHGSSL